MPTLSDTARREYHAEIADALPPPACDTPAARQARLQTAVETFAALDPADAFQARLVVQIVLCGAHAADSLRLARLHADDAAKVTRCRAQASSLMREFKAAKRILDQDRKAHPAATAAAAEGGRTQPLPRPAPQSGPQPAPQSGPQPAPQPRPQPAPQPRPQPAPQSRPQHAAQPAAALAPPADAAPCPAPAAAPRLHASLPKQRRGDVAFPTAPAVVDALLNGAGSVRWTADALRTAA